MSKSDKQIAPQYADIEAMSFEQAIKELETIVRKLETGNGELEAAISDYTRGTALREHCQKKLADAKLKVEKIIQSQGGVSTEDFDVA